MADVTVECALSFAPNIDINRTMICTNCAQMKRQLDDALLQLKCLQKIIELLQQDSGDSKIVNHEGTADKGAVMNYKEVKIACSNNSFSISNKSCKSDLDILINGKEDLDLFYDTKHRGNSSVSPATVALSSSLPAFYSKTIARW
jgi:hypothetical protein